MKKEIEPGPTRAEPTGRHGRPLRIVGILPAAGPARRLGGRIGTSKELVPVADGQGQNRPVSHYLLDQMVHAGCDQALIVLRPGKWDIAETFGSSFQGRLPLAYLTIDDSWGPPFTLAQAFPFADDAVIATGFPDILMQPSDALRQVIQALTATQADVVVATFPAVESDASDLCVADSTNQVLQIIPKEHAPAWGPDSQTWLLAAWQPSFTQFFSNTLKRFRAKMAQKTGQSVRDLPVGAIMAEALNAGYRIGRVHFPEGRFLDIGAPERLQHAQRFFEQSIPRTDEQPE